MEAVAKITFVADLDELAFSGGNLSHLADLHDIYDFFSRNSFGGRSTDSQKVIGEDTPCWRP